MPVLLVFVQALMVWLWGVNVYVFLNTRIPYAKVFELEHNHLTHHEIWKIASWMTVAWITSMTAYLYLYSHGMVFHAASQPVSTVPLSKNLVTVYSVIVASQVGFCDSFAQNMLDHRCHPLDGHQHCLWSGSLLG
jgi:hypothetical protein